MQTPVRVEHYPAPPVDFRELICLITWLHGSWSWHYGSTQREGRRNEASCDNSLRLYLLETTSTQPSSLSCFAPCASCTLTKICISPLILLSLDSNFFFFITIKCCNKSLRATHLNTRAFWCSTSQSAFTHSVKELQGNPPGCMTWVSYSVALCELGIWSCMTLIPRALCLCVWYCTANILHSK